MREIVDEALEDLSTPHGTLGTLYFNGIEQWDKTFNSTRYIRNLSFGLGET